MASYSGKVDILDILVSHESDLTKRNRKGDTPLHISIRNGTAEFSLALIEHLKKKSA
jgi:ankyrin repeat protein